MSDSVGPHRWQPTRLHRPWPSPGKNTGVGCHFLLQCMKVKSESEVAQSCPTLYDPHGLQPTRLLHPWDFPGKSTGVGCHCFVRFICIHTYEYVHCFIWFVLILFRIFASKFLNEIRIYFSYFMLPIFTANFTINCWL